MPLIFSHRELITVAYRIPTETEKQALRCDYTPSLSWRNMFSKKYWNFTSCKNTVAQMGINYVDHFTGEVWCREHKKNVPDDGLR